MKRTDTIMAIDGIQYDVKQRIDRGDKSASILSFLLFRIDNLKKCLEQEQKHNAGRRDTGKYNETELFVE